MPRAMLVRWMDAAASGSTPIRARITSPFSGTTIDSLCTIRREQDHAEGQVVVRSAHPLTARMLPADRCGSMGLAGSIRFHEEASRCRGRTEIGVGTPGW